MTTIAFKEIIRYAYTQIMCSQSSNRDCTRHRLLCTRQTLIIFNITQKYSRKNVGKMKHPVVLTFYVIYDLISPKSRLPIISKRIAKTWSRVFFRNWVILLKKLEKMQRVVLLSDFVKKKFFFYIWVNGAIKLATSRTLNWSVCGVWSKRWTIESSSPE